MRNLIHLWDINGVKINLSKYGLIGRRLIVPSPSYTTTEESVEGRPGSIVLGKQLNPRPLTAIFIVEASDYADVLLLRDELFNLFRDKFYVGEVDQPGKRWLVECEAQWELDRININTSSIEVPLTARKGLSESVETSLTPFEWDANMWQWGMGIPYDDYSYEHTTNKFKIYNAGTEIVDPRYMELKITIKGSATEYVELINLTTGETYRYNGVLQAGDTLVIDKLRSTKNSLSVFRDTNKKLITLAPGPNDFEIIGASVERISFDFRFYYV
ncbi:phage tail family protein [Ornithinibacillus xuwenensis]|uniref:Phage tail family protein n=1 Tax=Ornithinibacillus xuwenensis TaxID=3144668 RepID=A0ABU9XCB6_9BACI